MFGLCHITPYQFLPTRLGKKLGRDSLALESCEGNVRWGGLLFIGNQPNDGQDIIGCQNFGTAHIGTNQIYTQYVISTPNYKIRYFVPTQQSYSLYICVCFFLVGICKSCQHINIANSALMHGSKNKFMSAYPGLPGSHVTRTNQSSWQFWVRGRILRFYN